MTFVSKEFAEAEAARAIDLLRAASESQVEAWFAMQAVANEIGPSSNVGVRGLSWTTNGVGKAPCYSLSARCVNGVVSTKCGAPATLEEAQSGPSLARATKTLARKVAEMGGLAEGQSDRRPAGTGDALYTAVAASERGREWLASRSTRLSATTQLLVMVKVADRYGREGVNPTATLGAHKAFLPCDDRVELVRFHPTTDSARGRAITLGRPVAVTERTRKIRVSSSAVGKLAASSGASRTEARTVLQALLDGRSQHKLIRLVREAARMVEEMERDEPAKVPLAA